ncbi:MULTISPECIES: HutD/Ves family protein [Rhizobium/Agrobacterium group]
MQIIRKGDYHSMPWKNGGGETLEVAVHPPGASVNDFDWRVSIAKVAADGPFSIFPDIDRTLSLLDGDGIELVAETGSMNELQRGSEPFSFAADLGINGRLLNGPITDLNVMSRRGRFTHRVQRRVIDDTISIQPGAGTTMLIGNSPYIVLQPNAEIQPLDLVILTSSEITLRPLGRYAVIFIVELIPYENDSSRRKSLAKPLDDEPDFGRPLHRAMG